MTMCGLTAASAEPPADKDLSGHNFRSARMEGKQQLSHPKMVPSPAPG